MFDLSTRPLITLKWAQTIDGQLADDSDQSQWISGPEERRYTHLVRSRHDAVLVGAQTFLKDLCQLTVREVPFSGIQPARVILDPRGRVLQSIAKNLSLIDKLSEGGRRTYILTDVTETESKTKTDVCVIALPDSIQRVEYRLESVTDWVEGILHVLAKKFAEKEGRKLNGIMVEGGAATLGLFLKAGPVDFLEVAISPLILGGKKHRVDAGNLLANADRFSLESQERFGADVILRYSKHRMEHV